MTPPLPTTADQRCLYRALLRQDRLRPDKLASIVVRIVTRMQSTGRGW